MIFVLPTLIVGAAVLVVAAATKVANIKIELIKLSEQFSDRFFAEAASFIAREGITERALDRIEFYSLLLKDRRAQSAAIAALKDRTTPTNEEVANSTIAGLPEELKAPWRILFYYWLVAVSTQGLTTGIAGLFEITRTFSPERVSLRAESIILRKQLV
jgi:hypothetical protein